MRFYLHIVNDLSQFGVQIIEGIIFLLHFCLPDRYQGIETYKHFWFGTISLLHLVVLHLVLRAAQT